MPRRTQILIVEDDHTLREMYRWALVAAGFTVQQSDNGFDALQLIDRDPPDAVILDLGLPLVSGSEVLQQIAAHAHTRHIPVVVVTGSSEDFDLLSVACLLRKPVTADRLIEVVRKCLASGSGPAGA